MRFMFDCSVSARVYAGGDAGISPLVITIFGGIVGIVLSGLTI